MGHWYGQLYHDNRPTHASSFFIIFVKSPTWFTPHLLPRFGTLRLLAFPQIKITFEREAVSDRWWDSGKHNLAADGDCEKCVRSRGACFKGNWGIIVLCIMFLLSCTFLSEYLYVLYYMTGLLLDRPHPSHTCFHTFPFTCINTCIYTTCCIDLRNNIVTWKIFAWFRSV